MLFKFLGNADAPDWLLSEMNTLSLVSSVRIKFILLQVLNILIGAEVDYSIINKHLVDAKLTDSQKRAVLTLLSFIVENALRFNVEPEDLAQELTQLGAPHSHASTINRFYKEYRKQLRKQFKQSFTRFSSPELIEYKSEIIIKSSESSTDKPDGRLVLKIHPNNSEPFLVSMTSSQADDLRRELKSVIETLHSYK